MTAATPLAPTAGFAAGAGPLILVDLVSSRLARPMVRVAARNAIRRAAAAARDAGAGARPRVLLHTETESFDVGGVEILHSTAFRPDVADITDELWVAGASHLLVHGPGAPLFPVVNGISLGHLCLREAQEYLSEFAWVAGALRRAIVATGASRCEIFTTDPERAEALRTAVAPLVRDVRVWSPPLVRVLRQTARSVRDTVTSMPLSGSFRVRAPATPAAVTTAAPGSLEAPVLIVSETRPMSEMFAAVERHLGTSEDCRSTRMQFGSGPSSVTTTGNVTVVELGRPVVVPARAVGTFRSRWRQVAGRARSLVLTHPYGPDATPVRVPVAHLLEHLHLTLFDQMAEHIAFAQELFDSVAPEILVVGNDRWWVGQTFVREAQRRSLPTLVVQDGLVLDQAIWWWLSADHVAAFSPMWKQLLTAHGIEPDRITVTGQPRYDALFARRQRRGQARAAVRCAHLAIPTDATCVIVLATQPHQDAQRVGDVAASLAAMRGVAVLIRPHPGEPRDKYLAATLASPGRVSLQQAVDLADVLAVADVVVTEYSTVGLEAALLGIPVIAAAHLGTRPHQLPLHGIVTRVASAEQLRKAVEAVRAAEPLVDAGLLAHLAGPVDGSASERVADLILGIHRRRWGADASVAVT